MKALGSKCVWVVVVAVAIAGGAALAASDASQHVTQLEKRRQELRLALIKEQAELIAKDPDLMALHQQVQKLMRSIDKAMSAKPSIQKLNAELATVEKELDAQTQKDAKP